MCIFSHLLHLCYLSISERAVLSSKHLCIFWQVEALAKRHLFERLSAFQLNAALVLINSPFQELGCSISV